VKGNAHFHHRGWFARISSDKLWMGFFFVWVFLLTGILDFWIQTPGLKQLWRVSSMLESRRQEIDGVEAKTALLSQIYRELQENPIAQEREVRKVLGYLGDQEVVFEFSGR
jgi:hypothetical protein